MIEVHDTGCGIPGAEMENLFKEFYQLRSAPARAWVLAWRLSDASSICLGTVSQVGSVVGEGSCFQIEVPLGHWRIAPASPGCQVCAGSQAVAGWRRTRSPPGRVSPRSGNEAERP